MSSLGRALRRMLMLPPAAAPGPALRIALLTSARTWRGSGVSFANIAQGLRCYGHEVHAVAGEAAVAEAFAAQGLSAHRTPTGNTGWREALTLADLLARLGIDVVLVDRPRDLRLAALASLAHPMAIVNKYNLSRRRPPADLLTRLAYRRIGLTVFVSHTLAARALAAAPYLGRRPSRVIHEAVDAARFRPDPDSAQRFRAAFGLGSDRFVLAVGSLTLDKRYDFLLDLWLRSGTGLPRLVICGEGVHGERLKARASPLGEGVRFLGQLPADDLRGAYNAASCLVHTGAVETFGLSVLEGMACARPVVGAASGALPEVIGDAGLLAAADDPDGFLAALHLVLGSERESERLGAAARTRVLERFTLPRMWEAYAGALQALTDRHEGVVAPRPAGLRCE